MRVSAYEQWKSRLLLARMILLELFRSIFLEPKEALNLLRVVATLFSPNRRASALKALLENVGFSMYRKRSRLRLGRPSTKAFERLSPISGGLEGYPDQAFCQRQSRVKILVIRDGAMGDVLMVTPIVRELYERRFGRALIDVATKAGGVFLNSPYVNQVIPIRELGRKVREYDLVLDLNGVYERNQREHPVDAYALVALGTLDFNKKLDLFPSVRDVSRMEAVGSVLGEAFLVVHCPDHEWPNRRIPREFWQQLMLQIVSRTGWLIVQVGGAGDVAIENCQGLENHLGRYTIQELSVLMSKSRGFIGVDAGPAHIAATTDVPICVFYTCAHHSTRKPLRREGHFLPVTPAIDCYGCLTNHPLPRSGYHCERDDNACTRAFELTEVAQKITDFLKSVQLVF